MRTISRLAIFGMALWMAAGCGSSSVAESDPAGLSVREVEEQDAPEAFFGARIARYDSQLTPAGSALLMTRLRAAATGQGAVDERRPEPGQLATAREALRRADRERVAGIPRAVFRRARTKLRRAGHDAPTEAEVVAHVRAQDRAIAALNDALAASANRLRQLRRTGRSAEADRLERQIERQDLPTRSRGDDQLSSRQRAELARRQLVTVMNRLARQGR